MAPTQAMFNTYALGWDVRDYRGAKIVWHGGAVFGFLTAVVLIPEKHVGFSIEINSEDGGIIIGLMYELLDHYLGLPKDTWPEKVLAERQKRVQEAFLEAGALQCGYCTSGMIMSALALLKKTPQPNENEIVNFMNGNICRCGTYHRIHEAIVLASSKLK